MKNFAWGVIGAGPAGIAAVGRLLDHGIPAERILWMDPAFKVGDFGTLWANVPSNTTVEKFLKFLNASPAFQYTKNFSIEKLSPDKTCHLNVMAEPLHFISELLCKKVVAIKGNVDKLTLKKRNWHISINHQEFSAKNVILATGATPKTLNYKIPVIPLEIALDIEKLKTLSLKNMTLGVFGSSHSAVLILRNLLEHTDVNIINFYKAPLLYAVYLNDWILFDDTGLKQSTAEWARQHLHGENIPRLQRVYSSEEHLNHFLRQCDKVVYAIGFERRVLPEIEGYTEVDYIPEVGIIGPGLFGLGIAFPESYVNPLGIKESRVGLWKFMEYLNKVLPIWLQYGT